MRWKELLFIEDKTPKSTEKKAEEEAKAEKEIEEEKKEIVIKNEEKTKKGEFSIKGFYYICLDVLKKEIKGFYREERGSCQRLFLYAKPNGYHGNNIPQFQII